MAVYVPPDWPTGVHPPGSEGFEESAITWLFEVVPPDFRLHGVLRRHPAALAAMARHHATACVEGARQGYRTARTELAEAVPPHAVDAVLAAYRTEGRRLAATAKAVELVERAIRGERFTARLLARTVRQVGGAHHQDRHVIGGRLGAELVNRAPQPGRHGPGAQLPAARQHLGQAVVVIEQASGVVPPFGHPVGDAQHQVTGKELHFLGTERQIVNHSEQRLWLGRRARNLVFGR